ncbi:MAG: hypothetical protein NTX25_07300 [Proteobacteria bacterium]|nr:hypothetical protein [Pseudomonadota bacterium]
MLRVVISLGILFSSLSAAGKSELRVGEAAAQVLRVGGQYRVSQIEKIQENDFRIKFTSEPLTGKNDHLVLHSDHVHLSLQEGQVLRLSAEVLSDKAQELEVTQVLLFFPSDQGVTPIWLLSSQHTSADFHGARWLDMHAPQSDYLIL